MKIYRGTTKRLAKKHLGGSLWRKLQWGLGLKSGDVIAACTGYNVRITETKPCRWRLAAWYGKNRRGIVINDIRFTDEQGMWHHLDHCVWERESLSDIQKNWQAWSTERGILDPDNQSKIMTQFQSEGMAIFDAEGCLIG